MKDTGGPAFPSTHPHGREEGMTLRDWFAGMAMQSFTAHVGWKSDQHWFEEVAEGAYRQADAMLKERSKE